MKTLRHNQSQSGVGINIKELRIPLRLWNIMMMAVALVPAATEALLFCWRFIKSREDERSSRLRELEFLKSPHERQKLWFRYSMTDNEWGGEREGGPCQLQNFPTSEDCCSPSVAPLPKCVCGNYEGAIFIKLNWGIIIGLKIKLNWKFFQICRSRDCESKFALP